MGTIGDTSGTSDAHKGIMNSTSKGTGAFYSYRPQKKKSFADSSDWFYSIIGFSFDASRYNPDIYGVSDTVQPNSISAVMLVKY